MQFTGFKDKNNKEIYERDIVKDIDGNICIIEPHKICKANTVASFIKPIFGNYDFHNIMEGELEFIGNIYENPELIN